MSLLGCLAITKGYIVAYPLPPIYRTKVALSVATAVAINLQRLHNWWNELPLAQTQTSRFVRLMAA
jgi:hypothetical protein